MGTRVQNPVQVREAILEDAGAIARIFNEEVELGHATYETVRHSETQRREWLRSLLERKFPVLIADTGTNGTREILGFAALTPFHPASGYRLTATAQVYLTTESRGLGHGTVLVERLYDSAVAAGFRSVIAGVNSKNLVCQALLKKIGFEPVGHFRQIGFKNGQWWDDICFQLMLPDPKE